MKKLKWAVFIVTFLTGVVLLGPSCVILYIVYPALVGESISRDFKNAVNEGDDIEALVLARKYEKWERNLVRKRHLSDPKFIYPGLYCVAYELAGSYQKSLKYKIYRDKNLKIGDLKESRGRVDIVYNSVDGEGFGTGTARLYYKMGLRRQAFWEYCKELRTEDSDEFDKNFERRRADAFSTINRVTLTEPEYGSDKPQWYHTLSCFDYPTFLRFMDEEYEKLGRPAECEYTMKYLHAVGEIERETKKKKSRTRL